MDDFTAPIVDIGANLTNHQFRRDLPQVLRRAEESGLEAILITGTSMASSRDGIALVRRRQENNRKLKLFSTVGVHPHDAKTFDEDATLHEMRQLITENPGVVCAVGECGLDFNRDFSPRDKQERVFRVQVELACELQLPLFLHERDAHETFVKVLTPFLESGRLPPVVVHCFTGSESELRKYISMGFYIGLTGFVCMDSRGHKLRQSASLIPLDKLMIETDAPYMYPYGNNSRSRCEPKDLRVIVHTLASCFREKPDTIAAATTKNSRKFFALDKCEALRPVHGLGGHPRHQHHQKPQHYSESKGPAPVKTQETKQAHAAPPPAPVSSISTSDAIVLDGGHGEGGGQVVRIAMALASVFKKKIHIQSIRANRKIPGLRNQHVRTVELARQLTNGTVDGATIGSSSVVYDPQHGHLKGGSLQAESETGGSVSLMIQGSLPAMLFAAQPTTLSLRGGTHVGFSPSVDFIQLPLQQLLSRMGMETNLEILRRGFFPGGRGEVRFSASPLQQPLHAIDLTQSSSDLVRVSTRVTVYGKIATEEMGQEFVGALKRAFKKRSIGSSSTEFVWDVVAETQAVAARGHSRRTKQKAGKDGKPERSQISILTVVETAAGGVITVDRTEKDTPDYAATKITDAMARHLEHEVCVDGHLADNLIVYMALAKGTSRLRVPCKAHRTSDHLETALAITSQLTGATYSLEENNKNALVTVHGVGHSTS